MTITCGICASEVVEEISREETVAKVDPCSSDDNHYCFSCFLKNYRHEVDFSSRSSISESLPIAHLERADFAKANAKLFTEIELQSRLFVSGFNKTAKDLYEDDCKEVLEIIKQPIRTTMTRYWARAGLSIEALKSPKAKKPSKKIQEAADINCQLKRTFSCLESKLLAYVQYVKRKNYVLYVSLDSSPMIYVKYDPCGRFSVHISIQMLIEVPSRAV